MYTGPPGQRPLLSPTPAPPTYQKAMYTGSLGHSTTRSQPPASLCLHPLQDHPTAAAARAESLWPEWSLKSRSPPSASSSSSSASWPEGPPVLRVSGNSLRPPTCTEHAVREVRAVHAVHAVSAVHVPQMQEQGNPMPSVNTIPSPHRHSHPHRLTAAGAVANRGFMGGCAQQLLRRLRGRPRRQHQVGRRINRSSGGGVERKLWPLTRGRDGTVAAAERHGRPQ